MSVLFSTKIGVRGTLLQNWFEAGRTPVNLAPADVHWSIWFLSPSSSLTKKSCLILFSAPEVRTSIFWGKIKLTVKLRWLRVVPESFRRVSPLWCWGEKFKPFFSRSLPKENYHGRKWAFIFRDPSRNGTVTQLMHCQVSIAKDRMNMASILVLPDFSLHRSFILFSITFLIHWVHLWKGVFHIVNVQQMHIKNYNGA